MKRISMDEDVITCPRCGSHNVTVTTSATEKAMARHGVVYWVFVGWWLQPLLWLFFTFPMIVYRLIFPNRRTKTVKHTYATCQSCGHAWEVKN
jgi:transcription elongation factor Elf1